MRVRGRAGEDPAVARHACGLRRLGAAQDQRRRLIDLDVRGHQLEVGRSDGPVGGRGLDQLRRRPFLRQPRVRVGRGDLGEARPQRSQPAHVPVGIGPTARPDRRLEQRVVVDRCHQPDRHLRLAGRCAVGAEHARRLDVAGLLGPRGPRARALESEHRSHRLCAGDHCDIELPVRDRARGVTHQSLRAVTAEQRRANRLARDDAQRRGDQRRLVAIGPARGRHVAHRVRAPQQPVARPAVVAGAAHGLDGQPDRVEVAVARPLHDLAGADDDRGTGVEAAQGVSLGSGTTDLSALTGPREPPARLGRSAITSHRSAAAPRAGSRGSS